MRRLRASIRIMAFALLLALAGMQVAQAVHAAGHDIVLDAAEKCLACKLAAQPYEPVDDQGIFEPLLAHVALRHVLPTHQCQSYETYRQARPRAPPLFQS